MIFSSGSTHQIAESAFCAMLDHAVPSDWPMYELSAFLFFLGPMLIIVILYIRMGVTIRTRVIKFPGETKQLNSRTKPIIRMLGKVACCIGFPFIPFSSEQSRFFHIMPHCPRFISYVPLSKCSSVTFICIDNCSITDAVLHTPGG